MVLIFAEHLLTSERLDRLYMYFPSLIKWRMAFGLFEPFSFKYIYTVSRALYKWLKLMWCGSFCLLRLSSQTTIWLDVWPNWIFRFPCRTASARSAFYASDLIAVDGEWVILLPIYTVSHFQRSCRYRGGVANKKGELLIIPLFSNEFPPPPDKRQSRR
jgi:hypothetical protein